jgi:hypothetical protein
MRNPKAKPLTKSSKDTKAGRVTPAKILPRQMREAVEDIEDARTIEKAKRSNGNKARIPWSQVKKEALLD